MYEWIKLFEVVKKKGVHNIQTNKNNAQESFLIIDHFLLISLISKIDQGKIKTIKKIQIIPKGCCLGKPYLSPCHSELKNVQNVLQLYSSL